MKKVQLILTTLLFFTFIISSSGQLYIDAENNVAVGDDSTSTDAKMKVINSTETNGIQIVANGLPSNNIYGFNSTVTQNSSSSLEAMGYKASINPLGSGSSTGFFAEIDSVGTGVKTGIINRVNQFSGSSQFLNGIDNSLVQNGSGFAHGIKTDLQANGSGNVYGNFISVGGSGSSYRYGTYASINGGNGSAGYFVGDITVTGTVHELSDGKLKENINNINNALQLINEIEPKRYNFKDLKNYGFDSKKLQFGFIANDLENVLPNLVTEVRHPGRTKDVLIDGVPTGVLEILEPDETVKAVNYTGLIPLLTKAIQEQQAIIEDLRTRLERVERN